MDETKVVLFAAFLHPHAQLLDEGENFVVHQDQLRNSNLATASGQALIPDEGRGVNIACNVKLLSIEGGSIVLNRERLQIVEHRPDEVHNPVFVLKEGGDADVVPAWHHEFSKGQQSLILPGYIAESYFIGDLIECWSRSVTRDTAVTEIMPWP